MPTQQDDNEDFKLKYKTLKKKLRVLIYENECFQEELRLANKSLLRVKQDKSFLLDQLAPFYQNLVVSSSDSDLTDCSDSEILGPAVKRKKLSDGSSNAAASQNSSSQHHRQASNNANHRHNSSALRNTNTNENITKTNLAKKKQQNLFAASTKPAKSTGSKNKKNSSKPSQSTSVAESSSSSLKVELTTEEIERKLASLPSGSSHFNIPASLNVPPNQLFSDSFKEEASEHNNTADEGGPD